MTTRLGDAVELLDRSLAYTRVALAEADTTSPDARTPCDRWTLEDLLAHLADSLDVFTRAAGGTVPLRPSATAPGSLRSPVGARVAGLQQQACALLGSWTAAAPGRVTVGDAPLPSPLLLGTAALEITVHGWDVAQATGRRTPVPDELAARLLAIARTVVADADRGVRFGPARTPRGPSYSCRLLGFLGRE